MFRTYSILSTNQELLVNPHVRSLSRAHDLTLRVGEEEVVNFLIQRRIPAAAHSRIQLAYDPNALECLNVHIELFARQTLITLRLIAREVGSLRFGLSVPPNLEEKDLKTAEKNYTAKKVPTK